ncbi:penicillin-binding transpeptidase domain-containing protein [Lapillicoccus sp.]|uniref:penicillin-binding transpeptidase domain-containing protein n=1 Tax=Lapillicoccus sp. TaxID=1909287 RepID=UPI0025DAFD66|nr:penicillin-binding transpeptidase domain-containing protein [Lapillicoccus sp.]
MGALVVSLFALLLGRLGQVQVVQQSDYARAGAALGTRTVVQAAVRGRILDATGRPLVANTATLSVTIERRTLLAARDGGRALVDRVAAELGVASGPLWDRTFPCGSPGAPPIPRCFAGSAYQPIPVLDGVDPRRALTLLERPELNPGVGVLPTSRRSFPSPDGVNAAHLLGYVGPADAAEVAASGGAVTDTESVGRAGLEEQYDSVLRGIHGSTTVAVDPRGAVTRRVSGTSPVAGRDVVTHIAAPVQASAEQALAQAVATSRSTGFAADSGAAVVLDVRTGAVVAAASYPTYDPAVWTGGITQHALASLTDPAAGTPLVSRVTGGAMPPASTFKVVSVDAAAASGVDLGGTYDCAGSVLVGDRVFHNYESRSFGPLTLARNIEVSCDTIWYRFAYQSWLAQGGLSAASDAADPFVASADSFGLGHLTGIDVPGETAGRIPDRTWKRSTWEESKVTLCRRAQTGYPEVAASDPGRATYLKALAVESCTTGFQYRAGDAANFAIGQGDVLVTPLQLARVYAAVANGGTLWTPQVAAATQDQDGTDRIPIAPVRVGSVGLQPGVKAFLDTALQGVITQGTASGVFAGWPQAAYPLAGKTGSGEVFGKQATSWFASYGPVTDPRYAVVVMISQAGTGGSAAAPAARQIWQTLRAQPLS